MRSRLTVTLCVMLVVGALGLSGQVQGATITDPNAYFFRGSGADEPTTFKLVNYESAFTGAYTSTPNTWTETQTITEGSYLRGIFKITSSLDVDDNQRFALEPTPGNPVFELTGIFSGRVNKITLGGTEAIFELTPDAAFGTAVGQAGAMVAFYHDTSADWNPQGTGGANRDAKRALAWAAASDSDTGTPWLVLGAPANGVWGTDYYWNADGKLTPSTSSFAASLALLLNNTNIATSAFRDLTQDAADGDVSLGQIENLFALKGSTDTASTSYPWQLKSQDPLRAAVVPVPSAVWAGLGMLGMLGAFRARRRNRS